MNTDENENVTRIGVRRKKQPVEALGPCQVSIESPLITHVKFSESKNVMSAYKTKITYYSMDVFSDDERLGHIGICLHPQPYRFNLAQELRDFAEPEFRRGYGKVFTQELYNGAGGVTFATKRYRLNFGFPKEKVSFAYMLTDTTNVNGILNNLPPEKALDVINSIHAEVREGITPPRFKEMSLVQKLEDLKSARKAELITEEEYQQKKQDILSKYE